MTQTIIFHHPLPIAPDGTSGSRVRPYRMVEAFRELGYEVEVIAGYAAQRRSTMERIRGHAGKGRRFAFAYAESSTMPWLLTEPHHLPFHPFLDSGFFRWMKKTGVPIGLFYRDLHWRFDSYQNQVPWHKRVVAVPFYYQEWRQYRRWVDHLFLPSLSMEKHLPGFWPDGRVSALPPGCGVRRTGCASDAPTGSPLRLFYVGGVAPPLYDLRQMLRVVQSLDDVGLTVCCRAGEWEQYSDLYRPLDSNKVHVMHARGSELASLYEKAGAFLLFWKPYEYLDFAMPVKMFEALGHDLPLITTAGTEAARFVECEQIGWVTSTEDELRDLLLHLRDNPQVLARKQQQIRAAQERNTWQERARTVADVLSTYASH